MESAIVNTACRSCRGSFQLFHMVNKYILGPIRVAFYLCFFVGISLAGNVVQLVTLKWMPDQAPRIHALMCGFVWACLQFIFEKMHRGRVGLHLNLSEQCRQLLDADDQASIVRELFDKNAIVISNHRSWSDFHLIHALAVRARMLTWIKYIVKDTIKYLPGLGFGMYLMDMPFLKRSFSEDAVPLRNSLMRMKNRSIPYWLVLYPEGTRYSDELANESRAFALGRGLPILHNTLLPRPSGFALSIESLRDSIDFVLDVTLACRHRKHGFGVFPSIWQVHADADLSMYDFFVNIDVIHISELPESQSDLKQWLYDRFKAKDQLLESWKNDWPATRESYSVAAWSLFD